MLLGVELASIAILSLFLLVMARRGDRMADVLLEVALIAVAAWVGEVSCIRIYGFYQYDAPWTFFIDVMPLLVALIWPFVLVSAREVMGLFFTGRRSLVLAVAVMVFYDAALIEPIAVRAGLWSWNEPGLFGVPLIGIAGWAYFGALTVGLLDRLKGWQRLWVIVLAPAGTHLLLLATWWGGLRWILRAEIPPAVAAGVALAISTALAVWVRRTGRRIGLEVMAPRICAAILFFVLLAIRGRDLAPLVVYGVTFAPPYLLATRWSFQRGRFPDRQGLRADVEGSVG